MPSNTVCRARRERDERESDERGYAGSSHEQCLGFQPASRIHRVIVVFPSEVTDDDLLDVLIQMGSEQGSHKAQG